MSVLGRDPAATSNYDRERAGSFRGEVIDLTQIIGFVAGFGTTFAAMPAAVQPHRIDHQRRYPNQANCGAGQARTTCCRPCLLPLLAAVFCFNCRLFEVTGSEGRESARGIIANTSRSAGVTTLLVGAASAMGNTSSLRSDTAGLVAMIGALVSKTTRSGHFCSARMRITGGYAAAF
jgi:hypothetical protein